MHTLAMHEWKGNSLMTITSPPSSWTIPDRHDPLGILAASRNVLAGAHHVSIDTDAIDRFVPTVPDTNPPSEWDDDLHWRGDDDRTAAWVFVLDTLNFCFWADRPDPAPRWRTRWRGTTYGGYWALVAELRRAMDDGVPLTNPAFLAAIPERTVAEILSPNGAPDSTPIPLLPERVANLRQLGRGWQAWASIHGDDGHPARSMIAAADGSAAALVGIVAKALPSFMDVTEFAGQRLPFFKRAQILVADLAGRFGGRGPGAFHDLDGLTAFADYKVPQVLRQLGILRYAAALSDTIARYEPLPAGSRMEVEIRAATVWGCELIRQQLAEEGLARTAMAIDWLLWDAGQRLPNDAAPYHRTRTIFY